MVHEIVSEALFLDLLGGQAAGQLVDDGADHFKVGEFFGAYIRQYGAELGVGHGVALAEVAQGGADLAVGAAVLGHDYLCKLGVGVFDVHGVLKTLFVYKHQSLSSFSQGQGPFIQSQRLVSLLSSFRGP